MRSLTIEKLYNGIILNDAFGTSSYKKRTCLSPFFVVYIILIYYRSQTWKPVP